MRIYGRRGGPLSRVRGAIRQDGSSRVSGIHYLLACAMLLVAMLAGGSRLFAQIPLPSPSPSPSPVSGLTNVGTVYFVDNDIGNDAFSCTSPVVAAPPPSGQVTGPCKTIQHAIDLTRDRDLVVVASQEPIALNAAIEVPDLIGVIATGFNVTHCEDVIGGFSKIVLQSASGGPVFHITAAGMPTLHVLIAGFILGGTTDTTSGAVTLDHDEFTEIRCTIIGQEDLPNAIGILTRGSEHPFIHDNTVHGSTHYPVSVTLSPSPPLGGFGLVTDECLGGRTRTDQLHLERNLFSFNSNAGVWICSDGSGGHLLVGNNVRSNGRGVVLLSAVDTTLRQNFIGDNYYDGVDILDASANNLLDANQIESQEGPSSTGVLLQGSGALFPLGNTLVNNQIRRNHVDVLVSGARATRFSGNSITAIGERTGVLFAIGNTSGLGDRRFAQPSGTIFRGNKLYNDGECSALRGCAIRLLPGVLASIDAVGNDFGVSDAVEIQSLIWDRGRDAELGAVVFAGPLGVPVTPTVYVPPPVAVVRALPTRAPTVVEAPALLVSPLLQATPPAGSALAPAPNAASAATPAVPQPVAQTFEPPDPTAYIDPANGDYYVEVSLCVTNALGQVVAGDALTVIFLDGTGSTLGTAHVSADSGGCYRGTVKAAGAGAHVQPARLSVSDSSGGVANLDVTLGAPLVRPPRTPPQSG